MKWLLELGFIADAVNIGVIRDWGGGEDDGVFGGRDCREDSVKIRIYSSQ